MPKLVEIYVCGECPYYDNEYFDYNQLCCKLDRTIPYGEIPDDCPLADAPSESKKADAVQNCPKCGKHGDAQEFYSGGGYKAYTCNGCKTVWPIGINE